MVHSIGTTPCIIVSRTLPWFSKYSLASSATKAGMIVAASMIVIVTCMIKWWYDIGVWVE